MLGLDYALTVVQAKRVGNEHTSPDAEHSCADAHINVRLDQTPCLRWPKTGIRSERELLFGSSAPEKQLACQTRDAKRDINRHAQRR